MAVAFGAGTGGASGSARAFGKIAPSIAVDDQLVRRQQNIAPLRQNVAGAPNALPGYRPVQAPATPGGYTPPPPVAAARTAASAAVDQMAGAPNRRQIAADTLRLARERSEEGYQKSLRDVGQLAGALGRTGSGTVTNDLADVFLKRERDLDMTAREVALRAAADEQNDLATRASARIGLGQFLGGESRADEGLAQSVRGEARGERDTEFAQALARAAEGRSALASSLDAEDRDIAAGQALRDELRGERQFHFGADVADEQAALARAGLEQQGTLANRGLDIDVSNHLLNAELGRGGLSVQREQLASGEREAAAQRALERELTTGSQGIERERIASGEREGSAERTLRQFLGEREIGSRESLAAGEHAFQGEQNAAQRALSELLARESNTLTRDEGAAERANRGALQTQSLGFQGQEGAAQRQLQRDLAVIQQIMAEAIAGGALKPETYIGGTNVYNSLPGNGSLPGGFAPPGGLSPTMPGEPGSYAPYGITRPPGLGLGGVPSSPYAPEYAPEAPGGVTSPYGAPYGGGGSPYGGGAGGIPRGDGSFPQYAFDVESGYGSPQPYPASARTMRYGAPYPYAPLRRQGPDQGTSALQALQAELRGQRQPGQWTITGNETTPRWVPSTTTANNSQQIATMMSQYGVRGDGSRVPNSGAPATLSNLPAPSTLRAQNPDLWLTLGAAGYVWDAAHGVYLRNGVGEGVGASATDPRLMAALSTRQPAPVVPSEIIDDRARELT